MADRTMLKNALSNELNILIVSPNTTILTSFKENLFGTWEADQANRPYACKVHITNNVTSATEDTNPVKYFDYYVFVIEPKFMNCLKDVEEHLKNLGERCGRQNICLVAIGANYSAAVKPDELWKFAQIYQFNLLIGDLKTEDKAKNLSSRILNLCEVSCGLINGIPLVGKI